MNTSIKLNILFILMSFSATVTAETISVPDLVYSERIQGYIHTVDYHNKTKISAASSSAYAGHASAAANPYGAAASVGYAGASSSRLNASSQTDYHEFEASYSYLETRDITNFTADIRGEIRKGNRFTLSDFKPTPLNSDVAYDVIGKIKKGFYPGANYVLFGTVSEMTPYQNTYTPDGSDRVNLTYGLTLVAQFRVINTKTFQDIASFSATGEGSDTKIISAGIMAEPNHALIMRDVSVSLGQDVIKQLNEQVFGGSPSQTMSGGANNNLQTPKPYAPVVTDVMVIQ
jgi:hypothetical protein